MTAGFIYDMLNQTATYWAPQGYSHEGAMQFASPVRLKCRWEEKTELFVDFRGEERRSEALVFVDRGLTTGGFLLLGISTEANPLDEAEAKEIKAKRAIPDITATETEYSVFL